MVLVLAARSATHPIKKALCVNELCYKLEVPGSRSDFAIQQSILRRLVPKCAHAHANHRSGPSIERRFIKNGTSIRNGCYTVI